MLLSGDRRRSPILDPQKYSIALRCFPVLEKLVTISATISTKAGERGMGRRGKLVPVPKRASALNSS